ncbi:MAG: translation initiation factor IF-1 [Cyanobacteria bacterium J06626_18]
MESYFVEMEGIVTEALANSTFRVCCDNNAQMLCDTSRKIRKNYIPITVGDLVKVVSRTHQSTIGCLTNLAPYSR